MKRLLKLFAIILVICMTLAVLASCDAGNMDAEHDDGGGYGDIINNSQSGNSQGSPEAGIEGIIGGSPVNPDSAPSIGGDLDDNYGEVGTPEGEAPDGVEPDEGMDPEDPEGGVENETSGEEKSESTIGEDETTVSDPNDGSGKVSFIQTPFISVESNKFSTFSADVDTASYTYFRKLVNTGYTFENLRNSGSVFRTEEFINYFRYNVAQPSENELFGVHTEIVACPWNSGTHLLRVTLQAENARASAGNNLIFLIDVSGSMSTSDKLPLLKKAFSYLIGNLGPNDTVSIVTYSGREAVVLDGCRGADGTKITAAMESLTASGSTNGEAGITMAYQIAEKHFIEGGNNRIIMASDGDLNVGISSADELKSFIEQKRDMGIYLSVLGFGTGNYRDDRMEALADNGNGVYYYIDGESEAEKVFGTDLVGTLYTVANDVKLQIEFDPAFVESYRLIGYDNRVLDKDDFEDDTKDAGEVGASHQVTVCYEIKLKPSDLDGATYMTLRVRYKNPGESLSLLNEYAIGGQELAIQPSDDTRFISAVVELATLLRNREYSGEITLGAILEELDSLTLTDSYKTEFRELVRKLAQ